MFASTVVVEGQLVVEVEVPVGTPRPRRSKDPEYCRLEAAHAAANALDIAGRLVLPTFGVAGLAAALLSPT